MAVVQATWRSSPTRGESARARRFEEQYTAIGAGPVSAIISVRVGNIAHARGVLGGPRALPGTAEAEAIEGELAMQSGDNDAAIAHLSSAVRDRSEPDCPYFLAAETLGHALVRGGRLEEAIDAVTAAASERARAYDPKSSGPLSGYCWSRVRLLQAELLARASRVGESREIARELEDVLKRADSDFPILRRAEELARADAEAVGPSGAPPEVFSATARWSARRPPAVRSAGSRR
jgi:tetratricopeptide (TPR) repeat protein